MKTLEKHYEQLRDWPLIQEAEAFDITVASKWFFENPDLLKADLKSDYPFLVPPYPVVWMEHGSPSRLAIGKGEDVPKRHRDSRVACLAVSGPFDGDDQVNALKNNVLHRQTYRWAASMPLMRRRANDEFLTAVERAVASGTRAHRGTIFYLFFDDGRLIPFCATYIYLDELGNIVPSANFPIIDPFGIGAWLARFGKGMDWYPGMVSDHLGPFFFALSLMNAKNVSIVDAPPLPPAVAKKRERKGQPVLKFKTLHIEPMRARVKREKQEGQSEVKLALHLCRGHFKDYRDSGGLFGKYKGLYWWDSHVRGTEEAGRVIKDYELGKPKGA